MPWTVDSFFATRVSCGGLGGLGGLGGSAFAGAGGGAFSAMMSPRFHVDGRWRQRREDASGDLVAIFLRWRIHDFWLCRLEQRREAVHAALAHDVLPMLAHGERADREQARDLLAGA